MSKKDLYIAEMRRLLDHWNEHVSRNKTREKALAQQEQCDNNTPDELRPQRSQAGMTQATPAMPS